MTAPASQTYDLSFVLPGKRFFWKNPNVGVTITDAGAESCLTWQNEGRAESRLWTDIVAVKLTSANVGRDTIDQCRITFRDGGWIVVSDTGASGLLDAGRTPTYRAFVGALHARLAQAPAGTISFHAGASEGRYKAMQVVLVIAALFFVATPLVLLMLVGDWRILGILAGGAGLIWPFWKLAQNNRPRSYDPRRPPNELME